MSNANAEQRRTNAEQRRFLLRLIGAAVKQHGTIALEAPEGISLDLLAALKGEELRGFSFSYEDGVFALHAAPVCAEKGGAR
jgi:hypothetical protein